jgi:hypothetical protein
MFSVMLMAGWVVAAQPAKTENAELQTQVNRLVRQLDANEKAKRDAAEEALIKFGPAILDLLPTRYRSEEEKQRVGRIRQKLQNIVGDDFAKASLVTLSAEKMPLSKILAAIQRQTGNTITDGRKAAGGPIPDPELTVAFHKTPFWKALDTVLDQAGLTVYPFVDNAIQIMPLAPQQLPRVGQAAYSGPFRLEPVRIVARRELRTRLDPVLMLTLQVAWEPRLKPIGLKQRRADVKAVDDTGKVLAIDDPEAETEALLPRGATAVDLTVPLGLPARPAKEIASLAGSVQAMIPGKTEEFKFTDLIKAKEVQRRIAGATVTLEQVRKTEDKLWEVNIRVQFDDAGKSLESHRAWITQNEAYLEGPDGKPITPDSSETTQRSKDGIGMGYVFALEKPPEGMTFVYKTPGTIITRSFPYELKNIPLP